jgi:hypothetical protein
MTVSTSNNFLQKQMTKNKEENIEKGKKEK